MAKVNHAVFLTLLIQFLGALAHPGTHQNLSDVGPLPKIDTGCKSLYYTSQYNCSAGDTQYHFCQGSFIGEVNPGVYNTSSHSCHVGNDNRQSILTGSQFNVLCKVTGSQVKLGRMEAVGENRKTPPTNAVIGGIKRDHSTKMYVVVCSLSNDGPFDKPGKWDGNAHAVDDGGIEKSCSRWQWVTCEQ